MINHTCKYSPNASSPRVIHLQRRTSSLLTRPRMISGTRGSLIVFEGLDRAGKTTQCNKLVDTLRAEGRDVKAIRFPSMFMYHA